MACSYCKGWGRIWFNRQGNILKIHHKWGYEGWSMPTLGVLSLDKSEIFLPSMQWNRR